MPSPQSVNLGSSVMTIDSPQPWVATGVITRSAEPMREQWQFHKARILELYAIHKLPQVRKIMSQEFDFNASVKSYRDHLAAWAGNNKNLNEALVASMFHKNKQRELLSKRSRFEFRGRVIDSQEVERYMKRRKKYTDGYRAWLEDSRPKTPDGLRAFTPSPSPPPSITFQLFAIQERLFDSVDTFLLSSLVPHYKSLFNGSEDVLVISSQSGRGLRLHECDKVEEKLHLVLPHHQAHDTRHMNHKTFDIISSIHANIKDTISHSTSTYIDYLFKHILSLKRVQEYSVFQRVCGFFAEVVAAVLGDNHPFSTFCSMLARLEADELDEAVKGAWDLMVKTVAQRIGDIHPRSQFHSIHQKAFLDSTKAIPLTETLLARCEVEFGICDGRTLTCMIGLISLCISLPDYDKAERRAYELLEAGQQMRTEDDRTKFCAHAYHSLARCRYGRDDRFAAVHYAWLSIRIGSANAGLWERGEVGDFMLLLKRWQIEWGEIDAARCLKSNIAPKTFEHHLREDWVWCEDPHCTIPTAWATFTRERMWSQWREEEEESDIEDNSIGSSDRYSSEGEDML